MNAKKKRQRIVYHIDAKDKIVKFNPDWDQFASDNDAPHLAGEKILGQNIFTYISGESVRDLWSSLFKRCRGTGEKLRFDYRCDSPRMKRFMTMELIPLPGQHIELISTICDQIEFKEHRFTGYSRNDIISMCSWCNNIKVKDGSWIEIDRAINQLQLFFTDDLPRISHGICTACGEQIIGDYDEHQNNTDPDVS